MDVTDGIGTRVNPAPVCATPRAPAVDAQVAADVRTANLDAADRLLDKADRQVIEARRGIGVLRTGKGSVAYPLSRVREATLLLDDVTRVLHEAMGMQPGAGEMPQLTAGEVR